VAASLHHHALVLPLLWLLLRLLRLLRLLLLLAAEVALPCARHPSRKRLNKWVVGACLQASRQQLGAVVRPGSLLSCCKGAKVQAAAAGSSAQ